MRMNSLALLAVVFLTAIIFGCGGYYFGLKNGHPVNQLIPNNTPPTDPVFLKQEAYIQGKVTAINGSLATVENTQGKTGKFLIASTFNAYTANQNSSGSASTRPGVYAIPLNQPLTINLELIGNQYQIVSVFSNLQLPPPPRKATSPAKPK